MKQIKTIAQKIRYTDEFDKEVNDLLAKGWKLTKREVMQAVIGDNVLADRALIAFLELEVPGV